MPQDTVDTSKATIFQIEALASALEHRNFSGAALAMGFRDKHRLIKAIERLAENLGLQGLAGCIEDEPVLPLQLHGLQDAASRVRASLADFEREATALRNRVILIRCLAYPSMVSIFLAQAVRRLEQNDSPGSAANQVRFVHMESRNRADRGSAVMSSLHSRAVDVAVGPLQSNVAPKVSVEQLYAWKLVAAIHRDHPLWHERFHLAGEPHIDIEAVAQYPLLVSPRSHQTRDLLEEHHPAKSAFNFELESSNTEARVALGRFGSRVPLVASDAQEDPLYDREWPMVSIKQGRSWRTLGGTHALYWRTDLSETVSESVELFVRLTHDAASVLRERPGGRLVDGRERGRSALVTGESA